MSAPSAAGALRLLSTNVGRNWHTRQVRASTGTVWDPGPRKLGRKGNRFTLDGSLISFTAYQHVVTDLSDDSFTLEWRDEIGEPIHVTTYTLASQS